MRTATTRNWDWISAGLLFLMLQMPAARLVTTEWAPFLYWTESMVGTGTILGLSLGVSTFRSKASALLALLYTCIIMPWQLSMYFKDALLLDRLARLGSLLGQSFRQFLDRKPVTDPLFFLLWVCLAFWLIGVSAGYALSRRGRTLLGIIAGGAAITIIQAYGNYQPRGSWWLAVFLMLAVLFAGRAHFLQRRTGWRDARVFVGEDAGGNILTGLSVTAGLVILAAWWIPAVPGSVERAADTWNNYVQPFRDRLSNAVTSLRGPYGKPGENFFGGALPLGQNAASGDQVVLRVEVLESPGVNLRYYWRGRVYSDYAAGTWTASPPATLLFHAQDQELLVPNSGGRSEASFRVTSEFPSQSLIYGPAPTIWLDRTADVAAFRTSPGAYDVFSWESRLPVGQGATYELRSTLRNPTVVDMQQAGTEYPSWVTSGYLAIPERYRGRLTDLAEQITSGQASAYDKAQAVTNYLRSNITYSPSVPAIPEGQDPVLWVLFDHKQGYCNYYASAEVLLLRSIGIPTRLAVGFSRGELIRGAYIVHRRDAHAWPEVYFPGIGWVEFEPTANQSPLARPSGVQVAVGAGAVTAGRGGVDQEAAEFPEQVELAPPSAPLPFRLTPTGRLVFTGLPILFAIAALLLAYRMRIWTRLPTYVAHNIEASGGLVPNWLGRWVHWFQMDPLERLFASVRWTLRLIGRPQPPYATPAMQAAALSSALPSARKHAEILQAELEASLFTDHAADVRRARKASVLLLLEGLRARLTTGLSAWNGTAVYSQPDFTDKPRGTK